MLLQSLGQLRAAQPMPSHPARQKHVPAMQYPRPLQLFGHAFRWQNFPANPSSHLHVPSSWHVPRSEHPFLQLFFSQNLPRNPSSQVHVALTSSQSPRPEHWRSVVSQTLFSAARAALASSGFSAQPGPKNPLSQ
jgi:hypothetical protein